MKYINNNLTMLKLWINHSFSLKNINVMILLMFGVFISSFLAVQVGTLSAGVMNGNLAVFLVTLLTMINIVYVPLGIFYVFKKNDENYRFSNIFSFIKALKTIKTFLFLAFSGIAIVISLMILIKINPTLVNFLEEFVKSGLTLEEYLPHVQANSPEIYSKTVEIINSALFFFQLLSLLIVWMIIFFISFLVIAKNLLEGEKGILNYYSFAFSKFKSLFIMIVVAGLILILAYIFKNEISNIYLNVLSSVVVKYFLLSYIYVIAEKNTESVNKTYDFEME